jgi:hypothetical protein
VIGASGAPFHGDRGASRDAAIVAARRIVELTGRNDVPILAGASAHFVDCSTPQPSAASDAIVEVADRAEKGQTPSATSRTGPVHTDRVLTIPDRPTEGTSRA